MEKKWYKSKTLWFNALVVSMTAVEANFNLFQNQLPVNVYALSVTLLAVGNGVLRVISSTKLTV